MVQYISLQFLSVQGHEGLISTLWAVRTAEDASDSRGVMGTGTRFMMALNRL